MKLTLDQRHWSEGLWSAGIAILGFAAVLVSLLALLIMLSHIFFKGASGFDSDFLRSVTSRHADQAGIYPALVGTLLLMGITILAALPLGIMGAIYLEEYASRSRLTNLVRLNIANLSGVPSIVYGMLGLAFFVRVLDLGFSLLAGALTMSLLILPIIIMSSSEALKAVPARIREAAYGVGATRSQTVFGQVLPQALPGIMTGVILGMSRAAGETAPVLLAGAAITIFYAPESVLDQYTTLSLQIFSWTKSPLPEFQSLAATAIIALLVVTLGLNAFAIFLRTRFALKKVSG